MRIVRETLETLTQCVLLPGVELKLDDVVFYLKSSKLVSAGLKKKARALK